ncbi:MAG: flavodoxin family protein [Desulfovibrio sp.]|nr:flavodoxin family protein [Desulfovibrio sp.]
MALLCSPRPGGVSDALAGAFAMGMADAGLSMCSLALRDYRIAACTACGACSKPPHKCVLAHSEDQAEELFSYLSRASFLLVASPIHFYALPAHFKAFVDRAQRFWSAQIYKAAHTAASRTAVALLAAGRPRGVRLFDGALLTLDYFCRTQNFKIQESLGFRALDTKKDLDARPQVLTCVRTKAHAWGRHLAGQRPQE